jgi:hypothetical protein
VKHQTAALFRARSIIALALIAWCAGAGCMIVSYARIAASNSTAASDSMDHAMSGGLISMAAHACCKARHQSAKASHSQASPAASQSEALSLFTIPAPDQSGVMSCCPLTSGTIVVASRSQSNDPATVLQHAHSSSLLLFKSDPAPLQAPQHLTDRAGSYLLDCAFLI